MFEHTLDWSRSAGLTLLHVFPFSPRPGTPAARMPQVRRAMVKDRAARLRAAGEAALAPPSGRARSGARRRVLVETSRLGRTEDFTPVRLASSLEPGDLCRVAIAGHNGAESCWPHDIEPCRCGARRMSAAPTPARAPGRLGPRRLRSSRLRAVLRHARRRGAGTADAGGRRRLARVRPDPQRPRPRARRARRLPSGDRPRPDHRSRGRPVRPAPDLRWLHALARRLPRALRWPPGSVPARSRRSMCSWCCSGCARLRQPRRPGARSRAGAARALRAMRSPGIRPCGRARTIAGPALGGLLYAVGPDGRLRQRRGCVRPRGRARGPDPAAHDEIRASRSAARACWPGSPSSGRGR